MHEGDEYRQLSTTLLQIENEFYGTIRPKRRIAPGERPLHALSERGVEYVEVRCLDIDPFEAIGIAPATARLLDVFLLHCLLADSPTDSPQSIVNDAANQLRAAERGREPGLTLTRADGSDVPLTDWGRELLEQCRPIAQALDAAHGEQGFGDALDQGLASLALASLTPSARVLRSMEQDHGNSYQRFACAQSQRHRDSLLAHPLADTTLAEAARQASASLAEQAAIEAADEVGFETFRERYLSQALTAPREGATPSRRVFGNCPLSPWA